MPPQPASSVPRDQVLYPDSPRRQHADVTTLERCQVERAIEPVGAARGDTWARRLLGRFHVTGVFWLRAIMWVARGSNLRAYSMVWLWSAIFFFLLRRPRRLVTEHIAAVLGPCGFFRRQLRIFRAFKDHAWCLVERFEQFRPDFNPRAERIGAWPEMPPNKGFIVVTAHVGLWEIGQLMPVVSGNRKLHVIREREEHEGTQQVIGELLENHPHADMVTHFLDDDQQLGATLLGALRKGDVVTLAGDRARAGMMALRTKMFGRTVQFPMGPLALARAAEVQLVPTFVFRVGRRHYQVVGREAFYVARSADRNADIQAAADRLAQEFEWAVRQNPYQWKRWEPVFVD